MYIGKPCNRKLVGLDRKPSWTTSPDGKLVPAQNNKVVVGVPSALHTIFVADFRCRENKKSSLVVNVHVISSLWLLQL